LIDGRRIGLGGAVSKGKINELVAGKIGVQNKIKVTTLAFNIGLGRAL